MSCELHQADHHPGVHVDCARWPTEPPDWVQVLHQVQRAVEYEIDEIGQEQIDEVDVEWRAQFFIFGEDNQQCAVEGERAYRDEQGEDGQWAPFGHVGQDGVV